MEILFSEVTWNNKSISNMVREWLNSEGGKKAAFWGHDIEEDLSSINRCSTACPHALHNHCCGIGVAVFMAAVCLHHRLDSTLSIGFNNFPEGMHDF